MGACRAFANGRRPYRRRQTARSDYRSPDLLGSGQLLASIQDASAGPPDPAMRERVFAVLYYVAPSQRAGFARTVRSLGAVWLSSEAPGCCPGRPAPRPGRTR